MTRSGIEVFLTRKADLYLDGGASQKLIRDVFMYMCSLISVRVFADRQ